MSYDDLIDVANARWSHCEIRPNRVNEAMHFATQAITALAKLRYLAVEKDTTVPWFVVPILQERESGLRWDRQLAQGDPLDEVSRNVPRGRGPFLTHEGDGPGHDAWHRGALDALIDCPPHLAHWTDWSAGGVLVATLLYNGIGKEPNVPSSYLWGGTNIQVPGKWVRDHVYNPNVWDTQLGTAAMLIAMRKLDPTIKFAGESQ